MVYCFDLGCFVMILSIMFLLINLQFLIICQIQICVFIHQVVVCDNLCDPRGIVTDFVYISY